MADPRICAVFLFNHKFEPNVAKLDRFYAERFSHRLYVMPFGTATDKVIPVYETSYRFSGHLAQARGRLLQYGFDHYVVISDDLILNPALNEHNIIAALGLGARSGYIKSLASIDEVRYRWWRSLEIVNDFRRTSFYFDYKAELPSAEEALTRFMSLGLRFPRPKPRSLAEWRYTFCDLPRLLHKTDWGTIYTQHGKPAPYPLLCGYSDFFVVPGVTMERFLHYCGVFAALNVFAEAAIPTALALACENVVTELEIGELFSDPAARRRADAFYRGVEFWKPGEMEAFASEFSYNASRLNTDFPNHVLYVHPVKLSRWKWF